MGVALAAVDYATARPEQIAASTPAPTFEPAIAVTTPHLHTAPHNAAATVDQLRELPVSGGARVEISGNARVVGQVVGVNNGTLAMVNGDVGTLLNLAEALKPWRLEARSVPPAMVQSFLDRVEEAAEIRRRLAQGGAVWLLGSPGSGLTALLRQAANAPEAGGAPDGVLYLDGADAPAALDDLVQSIFSRFWGGTARVNVRGAAMQHVDIHVSPGEARTHLGTLQATVVLDALPYEPGELQQLRDILGQSTLLVAAGTAGPDTFAELPLGGLPDADARAFLGRIAGPASSGAGVVALVEQLCPALGCLPLPLRLAGRLLRHEVYTLPELVAAAAQENQAAAQGESAPNARRRRPDAPLATIVRLMLQSLSSVERAVLEVLTRSGSGSATLELLAGVAGHADADVQDALGWLAQLGVVEGGARRYRISSGSLRRALNVLLPPSDVRARIAAFLAAALPQHGADLAWLEAERGNLVAAIDESLVNREAEQAGRLARAVQPVLLFGGWWDAWAANSEQALRAAGASGDASLRAWALHERGSRAGLVNNMERAAADLKEASNLRAQLGDGAGAAASEHNLRYLGLRLLPPLPPPPWYRSPRGLLALLGLALAAVLSFVAGPPIVSALTRPDPTVSRPTSTATDTPAPSLTATAEPLLAATEPAVPTVEPTLVPTDAPTPLPPVSASFADRELRVVESAGQISLRVVLSATSPEDVTLVVSTGQGSATAVDDYSVPEQVTLRSGQLEGFVVVSIVDDRTVENNETLQLGLSGAGFEPDAPAQTAVLTIVDDDQAPSVAPSARPTDRPTAAPTLPPTSVPTRQPTLTPTQEPTWTPTQEPSLTPTETPTIVPPSDYPPPLKPPTWTPSTEPTWTPTEEPTFELPPDVPTPDPTIEPPPPTAEAASPTPCCTEP